MKCFGLLWEPQQMNPRVLRKVMQKTFTSLPSMPCLLLKSLDWLPYKGLKGYICKNLESTVDTCNMWVQLSYLIFFNQFHIMHNAKVHFWEEHPSVNYQGPFLGDLDH